MFRQAVFSNTADWQVNQRPLAARTAPLSVEGRQIALLRAKSKVTHACACAFAGSRATRSAVIKCSVFVRYASAVQTLQPKYLFDVRKRSYVIKMLSPLQLSLTVLHAVHSV